MGNDFVKFLLDIGYANHTARIYLWRAKKIAAEYGYKNLTELADDVFILLDQGKHGDRKFGADTLSSIQKNKNVLVLFNSFLFDIKYRRNFVVPCSSSANYMRVLTTDQHYIRGKQPRTLVDKEYGKNTGKKYFNISEVADALHVNEKTLQRWADCGNKPYRYKGIPPEASPDEIENHNPTIFNYYYYKLDEINEFLASQFLYASERKKEIYMSDTDPRKKAK